MIQGCGQAPSGPQCTFPLCGTIVNALKMNYRTERERREALAVSKATVIEI